MEEIKRIDKWLWEVRVFKTRNQATMACRAGKVQLAGQEVKPSRELQPGDEITFYRNPIKRTFRVIGFPRSRVGARLVSGYMEEITPPEEFRKLKMIKEMNYEHRDQGEGRPTKRQRRDIEELKRLWKK
ncbi:MAG: RNA-binding S4 domain-containing protein [Bacteroidales bacterium]|nr:RNA-binding S4 domain-containing protein [Bacteroidota bacterium]MBL6950284.1 RNA-binding S4 domain-containing protein [Bacteroidales bacterium]